MILLFSGQVKAKVTERGHYGEEKGGYTLLEVLSSWPTYEERWSYGMPRELFREGLDLHTPVHSAYYRRSFREEESKVIVKEALEGRPRRKTEKRYSVMPRATFSSLGVTLKLMF